MIPLSIPEGMEAADIHTIRNMEIGDYTQYLKSLFFFDHHENLRSSFGDYPVATTPEQVDALIQYLEHIKTRM